MSKLSRRSVVAAASALPALAIPAAVGAAAAPDPVFAAIQKTGLRIKRVTIFPATFLMILAIIFMIVRFR